MDIKNKLKKLTELNGVSGFENDICGYIKNVISPFCDTVYENKFNSIIGVKKSTSKSGKKLMIEAHLDQIGLMVSEIDENGFLKFVCVGGVDKRILPGSEVFVLGKEKIYGIIGALPPHLSGNNDKEKMPDVKDFLIDTGYSCEEIKKRVSVGDSVILKSSIDDMMNSSVCAPALDNRAGVTAVLSVAEKIKESPYDIYFVFSSEEEIGLHGAYQAATEVQPDISIVVDVTHGRTPDSKDEVGVFNIGSGAVICKSPTLNYEISKRLIDIANKKNIKYDVEVSAGNTGTNAWAIQRNSKNCQTGLISIPLKYMHTSVEVLDITDIEATANLLIYFAEGVEENA